ncbi:hypothetical protein ACERII_13945 [Evansella sp. AB-rgal1]|uniref:hypothetical protein n=1 Tax=Evansella sp. AB-rgal1 TaxID=3242696 RepID=UPI00359E4234
MFKKYPGATQLVGDGDQVTASNNFSKGVAYVVGSVTGVNGYQKVADLTSDNKRLNPFVGNANVNPFNSGANLQAKEINEIAQMAQTQVTDDGREVIANGAIQQVVTADTSYVQVRDKTGEMQIVSKYGSGDSSLKKGEVLYQDLTVSNGSLSSRQTNGQDIGFYKQDASGGKVLVNRQINIDANELVAQKPVIPSISKDYIPYNQQVEQGTFYANDLKAHSDNNNIEMIVERDRSYVVGTTGKGKEYRFSSYSKGDPSLNPGEVRRTRCSVSSANRIVVEESKLHTSQGNVESVEEIIDPNNLIPRRPNRRIERRRQNEENRARIGV